MFEVIKKFHLFVYNPKTRGHKLTTFVPGDKVKTSIKKRLRRPDLYLK